MYIRKKQNTQTRKQKEKRKTKNLKISKGSY